MPTRGSSSVGAARVILATAWRASSRVRAILRIRACQGRIERPASSARRRAPPEHEIEHAVPETKPSRLELRPRAIVRPRSEARRAVFEQRLGGKRGEHLAGIVFPVGRDVQIAAGSEAQRQLTDESRLQKPPLVVALLRPRVRKEDVNAGERRGRDHRGDDLDGIVTDHAHVRETVGFDALQQAADAGAVHLDPQKVVARPRERDLGGGLAHAEPDLEDRRRAPSEDTRRSRAAPARREPRTRGTACRARAAVPATSAPA